MLTLVLLLAQAARPDGALYNQARANMANVLANQPNYTCIETIDRAEQPKPKMKFETIDSLRFEVAFVDKRELYAWPGSKKFDETSLLDMAPAGASISTGAFAGHAQYLFRDNVATIKIGDWIEENGKRYARYPFDVPLDKSRYMMMKSKKNSATVGYSGLIWIDPESAMVTRIELHGDDIPERLEVEASNTLIEYATAKIGEREFWLPARSVEELTTTNGRTDRNVTRFSRCRAFTGESTLRFDDGPAPETAAEPVKVMELPPNLYFELQFDEALDSKNIHVGDPVAASLSTDIKRKGQVLFAKGSVVEVRLIRLQKLPNQIALEFSLGDVKSKTAEARLLAIPDPTTRPRNALPPGSPQSTGDFSRPGVGSFSLRGDRMTTRKGFRSIWITTAAAPAKDNN